MIKLICLLEIVFIIAKMAGFCTLSWFWITLPLWIGPALLAAIFIVALAVLFIYFFIGAVIAAIFAILNWLVGD